MNQILYYNRYKEDGHCKGVPECTPPTPIRLKWEMPQACIDKIETSYQVKNDFFFHFAVCHC